MTTTIIKGTVVSLNAGPQTDRDKPPTQHNVTVRLENGNITFLVNVEDIGQYGLFTDVTVAISPGVKTP